MTVSYYHKNIAPLGDASRTYIEERLNTLEEIRKIDFARVEVDREKKGLFHMSIQVNSGAHVYYASAKDDDINACAEEVRAELRKQMQSDKRKVRDLVRRGARSLKKMLTVSDDARL